jgi:hypothetical protein
VRISLVTFAGTNLVLVAHFFSSDAMLNCSWLQVDKGFVAQVAAVVGGRKAPMNEEQEQQAEKSIVGEFSTVKHVRGILSMGRYFMCEDLEEFCLCFP